MYHIEPNISTVSEEIKLQSVSNAFAKEKNDIDDLSNNRRENFSEDNFADITTAFKPQKHHHHNRFHNNIIQEGKIAPGYWERTGYIHPYGRCNTFRLNANPHFRISSQMKIMDWLSSSPGKIVAWILFTTTMLILSIVIIIGAGKKFYYVQ